MRDARSLLYILATLSSSPCTSLDPLASCRCPTLLHVVAREAEAKLAGSSGSASLGDSLPSAAEAALLDLEAAVAELRALERESRWAGLAEGVKHTSQRGQSMSLVFATAVCADMLHPQAGLQAC